MKELNEKFIKSPTDFARGRTIVIDATNDTGVDPLFVSSKKMPLDLGLRKNENFYFHDPVWCSWDPHPSLPMVANLDYFPTAEEGDGRFKAFFLPWVENQVTWLHITPEANYFFTSGLSGCTIRIEGSKKYPIVYHANAIESRSDEEAQTYMNHELLPPLPSKNTAFPEPFAAPKSLVKKQYQTSTENRFFASVFGYRNEFDEWQFFYQYGQILYQNSSVTLSVTKPLEELWPDRIISFPVRKLPPRYSPVKGQTSKWSNIHPRDRVRIGLDRLEKLVVNARVWVLEPKSGRRIATATIDWEAGTSMTVKFNEVLDPTDSLFTSNSWWRNGLRFDKGSAHIEPQ